MMVDTCSGGGVVFRHGDVDSTSGKGFAELCLDEPAVDHDDSVILFRYMVTQ
jgi:hypothetical protein